MFMEIKPTKFVNEIKARINRACECIILEIPDTLSLMAYMILAQYFWKFQRKTALWEGC